MKIRIGTRGSKLALWQARFVARALEALPAEGVSTTETIYKTTGDHILDRPLSEIGFQNCLAAAPCTFGSISTTAEFAKVFGIQRAIIEEYTNPTRADRIDDTARECCRLLLPSLRLAQTRAKHQDALSLSKTLTSAETRDVDPVRFSSLSVSLDALDGTSFLGQCRPG